MTFIETFLREHQLELGYSIAIMFFILVAWRKLARTPKHPRWRVKKSYQVLDRVNRLKTSGQKIKYLRQVNHFVFEEMILSALERKKVKIKRNSRYTGDGGIDGQAWIEGKHYLIQAKRYAGHINKQHIIDFDNLCRSKGVSGLFVHTGKTGGGAQQYHQGRIWIVSGQDLLDLLDEGI